MNCSDPNIKKVRTDEGDVPKVELRTCRPNNAVWSKRVLKTPRIKHATRLLIRLKDLGATMPCDEQYRVGEKDHSGRGSSCDISYP